MRREASTTQAPALEASQLERRFGAVRALDGLDLSVPQGTFYGLLGPNGAGKTTAIAILTTQLRPTAGRARVLGRDVVAERAQVRRAVGLVFQEPSLDRDLSGREQLDLHARLYHLPERRARVEEMLALVGIGSHADRPVRALSGGMRRRLEIARGLLHRPRVLFLDEPTLGLDVAARLAIWEHLRDIHARGETTLFLTTHAMAEADALCERVGILDRGRLVVEGEPEALKAALGGDRVSLELEKGEGAEDRLRAVAGVVRVEPDPTLPRPPASVRLAVTTADGPRRLPALLEVVRPNGLVAVDLHRPTLEEVFLHHTGHVFEPPGADPRP